MRACSNCSFNFWALGQFLLFGLPLRGQFGRLLLELGEFLFEPLQALARGGVGFLLQRLALDLQLHDAAVELVQFLGLRIDRHAQSRRGLVHQIDRLVGQKAVGDVAVGQGRRGDDCAVGDAHAVVQFVFLLDAAQDRDRVLDRRLADIDRLEAAFERGVLLDVLAVFVQCRRADAMELTARQRRLQHIGGVHCAFRLAGADQCVQFVDEQNYSLGARGDFLQYRLQSLLEFAAVFAAGQERAEIERQQLLVFEALRHVAIDDALRQPLDDRRLADPGLADQHRIVLGAARQHLDRAADLLVAADDRVELAFARRFGQVAGVFLQRVVALLGRGAVGLAALAHLLDRPVEALRVDPRRRQRLGRAGPGSRRQREQQPLDRHKAVAGALRQLLGLLEDPRQFGRHVDLARPRPLDLREPVELRINGGERRLRIAAGGADKIGAKALAVLQQDLQQVLRRQPLMAAPQRHRLRRLEETLRAIGVFLEFHNPNLVSS